MAEKSLADVVKEAADWCEKARAFVRGEYDLRERAYNLEKQIERVEQAFNSLAWLKGTADDRQKDLAEAVSLLGEVNHVAEGGVLLSPVPPQESPPAADKGKPPTPNLAPQKRG